MAKTPLLDQYRQQNKKSGQQQSTTPTLSQYREKKQKSEKTRTALNNFAQIAGSGLRKFVDEGTKRQQQAAAERKANEAKQQQLQIARQAGWNKENKPFAVPTPQSVMNTFQRTDFTDPKKMQENFARVAEQARKNEEARKAAQHEEDIRRRDDNWLSKSLNYVNEKVIKPITPSLNKATDTALKYTLDPANKFLFGIDRESDEYKENLKKHPTKSPLEQLQSLHKYDKYLNIPGGFDENVANFIGGFGNTASLGFSTWMDRQLGNFDAARAAEETKSGKAGGFAGYLFPAAAEEKIAGTLLKPIVGKLPKLAQSVAKWGTVGAVSETGQQLGNEALRGKDFDPASIAWAAGLSGALPVAGKGLQKAGKGLWSAATKFADNELQKYMQQQSSDLFKAIIDVKAQNALPAPKPVAGLLPEPKVKVRGNANTVETPEVILGAEPPRGLPEPAYAAFQREMREQPLALPERTTPAAEPVRATPSPRLPREAEGTLYGTEEGVAYRQPSDAPLSLPEVSEAGKKAARIREEVEPAIKEADDQLAALENVRQAAIEDEYRVLKQEADGEYKKTPAGLIRDSSGKVTNRYGAGSNKPQWLYEYGLENKYKRPSNKAIREIAEKNVDEGMDRQGFIHESGFADNVAGLKQYRQTLAKELDDLNQTNFTTSAPLKKSVVAFPERAERLKKLSAAREAEAKKAAAAAAKEEAAAAKVKEAEARAKVKAAEAAAKEKAKLKAAREKAALTERNEGVITSVPVRLRSKVGAGKGEVIDIEGKVVPEKTAASAPAKEKITPQPPKPLRTKVKAEPVVKEKPPAKKQAKVETHEEEDAVAAVKEVKDSPVSKQVYAAIDDAAAAARERMAARLGVRAQKLEGEFASELGDLPRYADDDLTDSMMRDLTHIGAAKMTKDGMTSYADWAKSMTDEFGDEIEDLLPQAYREAKEFVRKQKRLASKEGQAAMEYNARQTDEPFNSKIERGVRSDKIPWDKRWEKFLTQTEDKLISFAGLEKAISKLKTGAKKGKIADDAKDSLYKSARLFAGVKGKAERYIKTRLTPIVKAVEDAGYSTDDLGNYALAIHAKDVNEAGIISGLSNGQIAQEIERLNPHYLVDPKSIAAREHVLEQQRQELLKINKDLLNYLVDAGMYGGELRDTMLTRWKNYIPMFRSFEDDPETFAQGFGSALGSVGDFMKNLEGSKTRKILDPMENMVKNMYRSIYSAERNKVKLKLSDLNKADMDNQYIRKLNPNEQTTNKNVVSVRENGETVRYEVEPEVFKAFNNLDDESSNLLINVLSQPAKWLRAGATLTPDFALRNPMRDALEAYIKSDSGFNVLDFFKGMKEVYKKGERYQQWVDDMGGHSTSLSMDRESHRKILQEILSQPNNKKFINVVNGKTLYKVLSYISNTLEESTRVGEYMKALKTGVSREEAAFRSRDLLDFAKSGTSIKQANRIVPFLNANIQGKASLIRAFKKNKTRTIIRALKAVTLPTVGIHYANQLWANDEQKKTIDEAPNWMKGTFWLLAVPNTNIVARIPKPFDLSGIFANLPELLLDHQKNTDPAAYKQWTSGVAGQAAIPFQISGLFPMMEAMDNYSRFRQGEIIPKSEQGGELSAAYDPVRSSEISKLLSAGVDKITGGKGMFKNFSSPRIMDYVIRNTFGGLGTYGLNITDSLAQGKVFGQHVLPDSTGFLGNITGYDERPEAPARSNLGQYPLARSFFVDPLGSTESMNKMYDEWDTLNRKNVTASKESEKSPYEITGTTKKGNKSTKKYYLEPDQARRLNELEKAKDDISDLTSEIKGYERDMDMSPKEKRDKIEPLIKERNEIARKIMGK